MPSCGVCVCVSVCLSRSWIMSKGINISSKFFHLRVATPFYHTKRGGDIPTGTPPPPNGGVECRCGRQKSRFWAYLALLPAVSAATSQVLSTESPVEHGQRTASCDISPVVSGGVDCERRRRHVYDKMPQRYTKDNRTAHLTARSDKSVAYVTNNKRLYSTFCTVEANYWQTRIIARPLWDSRSTCFYQFL